MSVVEAIRQRKLKAAKRSISYGETRDKIVSDRAKLAKETINHFKGGEANKIGELEMKSLYYTMIDDYYGNNTVRMPSAPTKRSMALWERVTKACEEAEVPPKTYMKAQFAYFHKTFGRPPKVSQLATKKAKERAKEFDGRSTAKVIGNDIRHKGDFASIMRASEKQMQEIQRAQGMTREEVYVNLVIPGLILFPKEYLAADPIYKKVIDASSR